MIEWKRKSASFSLPVRLSMYNYDNDISNNTSKTFYLHVSDKNLWIFKS